MLYLTGGFLYLSSMISFFEKRKLRNLTLFFMLLLFFLSAFRYSIGADYYSYAYMFESMPQNIIDAVNSSVTSDPGFAILISLFKQVGLNYRVFIVFLSIVTLYGFMKPIIKKSPLPLLSLAVFFSVYYHIYVNSALRQGLAMSLVFYGFAFYYNQNKHTIYILIVLLAASFHISALIMLVVYPINFLSKKRSVLYFFLLLAIMFILVINITNLLDPVINYLLGFTGYSIYMLEESLSIASILTKIALLFFILYLYLTSDSSKTEQDKFYFMLYIVGTLIYFAFLKFPVVARVLDYLTMFEILLIPSLLIKVKEVHLRLVNMFLVIFIISAILLKDFHSFTYQEGYYINSALNYHYISVFNKATEVNTKQWNTLKLMLPNDYQ